MKILSLLLLAFITVQVHAGSYYKSYSRGYGSYLYGASYGGGYVASIYGAGYVAGSYNINSVAGGYGSSYGSNFSYYVYRSQYPYGMAGLKTTYDYETYPSFFSPCDPVDLDCQQYSNMVDLVTSIVSPLCFCILFCVISLCAKFGTCCKKKTVALGSAPVLEVVNLDDQHKQIEIEMNRQHDIYEANLYNQQEKKEHMDK